MVLNEEQKITEYRKGVKKAAWGAELASQARHHHKDGLCLDQALQSDHSVFGIEVTDAVPPRARALHTQPLCSLSRSLRCGDRLCSSYCAAQRPWRAAARAPCPR